MEYTVLINKITNKANQPCEGTPLFSSDFWRIIENVEEKDLVSTCQRDGCDYTEVEKWVEKKEREQRNFYME